MVNYKKAWDSQLKLGRRVELVIKSGLSDFDDENLDEIVESRWNDLNEDEQDLLKKEIDRFYQE